MRKKPVRLLMNLRFGDKTKKYVSVLAKETDCTYSHTVKLLDHLKSFGLIDFKKEGRVKFITLTKDGNDLSEAFENVLKKITNLKQKK
jgi:predicted transcriptional regulator